MKYGSKRAALIDSLRAMQAAFGGAGSLLALFAALLAAVSLSWFADAAYRALFHGGREWLAMLPLLAVLALAGLAMRRLPELAPVIEERQSRPARGMVMFLSPTRMRLPEEGQTCRESSLGERDPWRMPLVAIRRHFQAGALAWVAVIASEDSGVAEDGTWRLLDDFRRFAGDVVGIPAERLLTPPDFSHGVNFESASALWSAVEAALDLLRERGVEDGDIVIDVTGGQKLPAVLGGVAGLGEGLRLQYVSTRDYRVLEYDITMRIER